MEEDICALLESSQVISRASLSNFQAVWKKHSVMGPADASLIASGSLSKNVPILTLDKKLISYCSKHLKGERVHFVSVG